jgi:hypothetical protein
MAPLDWPDRATVSRTMCEPFLTLRRAMLARSGGDWQHEDYDVFDGDREIGRIYLVDFEVGQETWFWGVSFQVTKRKSYGYATSLEEAKAAFWAEYLAFKSRTG